MVALVSFEVAKRHLRIQHPHEDDDILLKLEIASEEIRDYLRGNTSIDAAVLDAWDDTSDVPAPVMNATLLRLAYLFEHRGDDPRRDEECWTSIEMVLRRLRTPAVAGGTVVTEAWGALRHVVTVENPGTRVIDEHGEYTTPFEFVASVHASIEGPPREDEAVAGSAERSSVTHTVEMDYHPAFSTRSRLVLIDGRVLHVRGLKDLEERHVRLVLSCEEQEQS